MTNELVQENFGCLRLISDAIKLSGFASEDDPPQSPRKGLETRAIVACGGQYTLCYLPDKDEWKRLADGLLGNRSQFTEIINFRDKVYTFYPGKTERYDPVFDVWSTLKGVSSGSAMVTVVRGEMYAIEINTHENKATITRYDVERCSWQTVLSSHEGCREDSCVVAAANHLYVFGGRPFAQGKYGTKAERFDTVKNKWEEIADMQQQKGNAFGVATLGKIFVAGGRQSKGLWETWLATCEMYDVSTNEWQFIASLNAKRVCGSMVCLKGTLYVLGGANNDRRSELSVECFDAIEGKWINKTTIPVKMISEKNNDIFCGCVVKLSKGVLNECHVVKE